MTTSLTPLQAILDEIEVRASNTTPATLTAVTDLAIEIASEGRRTANTLAATTGASTRELIHRLGHASSVAALRYHHLTQERDTEVARLLDELVQARRTPAARPARRRPRDGRAMEGRAARRIPSLHVQKCSVTCAFICMWALRDSNPRLPACKEKKGGLRRTTTNGCRRSEPTTGPQRTLTIDSDRAISAR
jgi:hypothetical protein